MSKKLYRKIVVWQRSKTIPNSTTNMLINLRSNGCTLNKGEVEFLACKALDWEFGKKNYLLQQFDAGFYSQPSHSRKHYGISKTVEEEIFF